jgi:pimeloyl-ACP methyl ester carboxylesterase
MLHGWNNSISNWESIALKLSKSANVILVDLPGFGQTQTPPLDWNIFSYANFVRSFINKLKLSNLIIVGHSFGGRIAIILGSNKNICHKVILIDSAGLNIRDIKSKLLLLVARLGKPALRILPKPYSSTISRFFGSDDYKNAGCNLKIFKNIVLTDLTEYAKNIAVPTLIIWGDKDRILPLKHALKFKEIIPNSTLRIVWGSDHSPNLEKPDKLTEIINEFI